MSGAPPRFEGILHTWNDERGFGFIHPAQGGQEVFVHVKAFSRRTGRPQAGQRLSFEVEPGPQGKKRARNVEPLRVARPPPRSARAETAQWGTATLFAIPCFAVVFFAAHLLWKAPGWLALVYLGASAFTFAAYASDKAAAQRGAWRTPEGTLHRLALMGGWPGALIAQQFLRHKSTKAEFRAVFWATVVANVAVFLVVCSALGRSFLQMP